MHRRVVLVAYPGFQALDLVGPREAFATAARLSTTGAGYTLEVVSVDGGAVRSSSGLALGVDRPAHACRGPIDTLMVVGGDGTLEAVADRRLVRWIVCAARRSGRVTSVCSGAYLLAVAGLLDGRRATTHWSECERLQRLFPRVVVEPDPIFVRDGEVWTSAGVTAGMDLALRLVEEDCGAELARAVARWLVLFVQRPGGQAQFSAQLAAQQPSRSPLRELQAWLPDHLAADLRVETLAGRCAMSPRHFARAFRAEMGVTPAAHVERLRLEAARRLLESTGLGVYEVARQSGFGTVETLHRCFRRLLGVTPGQYRRHFTAALSA